ncbi:MAG: sulfite exporter TauE/SafE family protein [Pseudomonadota bacterium]|nr:sulfite exporter TauE/SafE family protein [Pseudomonadota bacterium]
MLTCALGVVIGLVLALTGAGGGVLSVPLLVFGLQLRISEAGPVGLLAIALAAGSGAVLGLRERQVRYRAAGLMALCGALAAPAGLWCAQRLPNRPLTLLFAAVLLFVSLRMLRHAHLERRAARSGATAAGSPATPCVQDSRSGRLIWTRPCARALALAGVLAGFLSGLLGVGGGFVIVLALRLSSTLPMPAVIGTSLAVIAMISCAGAASAAAMGALAWPVALPFAAGALAGLLGGRLLTRRLAGAHLQMAFALVGALVAVLMVIHSQGS